MNERLKNNMNMIDIDCIGLPGMHANSTKAPNRARMSRIYLALCYEICWNFTSLGTGSAQPCFLSYVKYMRDSSLLLISVI